MSKLLMCSHCNGFLALALRTCPHCAAPVDGARVALLKVAALAGSGIASVTLMACYGAPCTDGICANPTDDAAAKTDAPSSDAADAGSDAAADASVDR
jgi:hypothetical protein